MKFGLAAAIKWISIFNWLDRIYRIDWIVGFLSFLTKLRKTQSGCAGGELNRFLKISVFPFDIHARRAEVD